MKWFILLFSLIFIGCGTNNIETPKDLSKNEITKIKNTYKEGIEAYNNKNYELAYSKLSYVAKFGHAEASFKIADMYDFAMGVDQNYEKATYWYMQAAERNHAESQYKLANRYNDGLGISKDREKAYKWYVISSKNSLLSQFYKTQAESMPRTMLSVGILSIETIKELDNEVKEWKPKKDLFK